MRSAPPISRRTLRSRSKYSRSSGRSSIASARSGASGANGSASATTCAAVERLRTEALDDPRCDGHGADDPLGVASPQRQPIEPVVGLVGRHLARERGQSDVPARDVDPELVSELGRAREERSRLVVATEVGMDRAVGAELAESADAGGGTRLLEQRHQLVAQPRRREIPHEAHLDATAEKPRRVVLEAKPVSRLVPDAAEDPRRVVDEREVVEDAQHACVEIRPATVRIDEPAEVVDTEGGRHGVDREVAPEEVLAQTRALDHGQRSRRVVELGARRDDVDPLAVPVRHDRRAEPLVGRCAPAERSCERVGERDRISLDGDVDVEALLAEEDVADRAADEVDAVSALAQLSDRIGDVAQARTRPKLVTDALDDFGRLRRNTLERAEKIGAAHDADELVGRGARRRDRPRLPLRGYEAQ